MSSLSQAIILAAKTTTRNRGAHQRHNMVILDLAAYSWPHRHRRFGCKRPFLGSFGRVVLGRKRVPALQVALSICLGLSQPLLLLHGLQYVFPLCIIIFHDSNSRQQRSYISNSLDWWTMSLRSGTVLYGQGKVPTENLFLQSGNFPSRHPVARRAPRTDHFPMAGFRSQTQLISADMLPKSQED